jgi:hypothetical protein
MVVMCHSLETMDNFQKHGVADAGSFAGFQKHMHVQAKLLPSSILLEDTDNIPYRKIL